MTSEPRERPKHRKRPNFAVGFVGYSAYVVARKGNARCATLDFFSGAAMLKADEGWVSVSRRSDLPSAIADLPSCIDELKALAASAAPISDDHYVGMQRGECDISVTRGADIDRFVSQLTKRFRDVESILEQAEKIFRLGRSCDI
jgi:hypothetical protein